MNGIQYRFYCLWAALSRSRLYRQIIRQVRGEAFFKKLQATPPSRPRFRTQIVKDTRKETIPFRQFGRQDVFIGLMRA